MLMAIKLLIFLIISYCIPYLLGMLFSYLSHEKNPRIGKKLLAGYILVWGILQIITIPAIYLKVKLSVFSIIFYLLISIASLLSLYFNRKRFKNVFLDKIKWLKSKPWLTLFIVALVMIQTVYISLANLEDHDDSFFVAAAETAMETDTLMEYDPYTGNAYTELPSRYVLSPFPVFIAILSNLLNIRAATTAHTLLALILIPLSYIVWHLTGTILFDKDDKKASVFLLIVMCILVFSGYSAYNQGMFMHIRIWQGKAILASILLPFIFYQGLCIFKKEMSSNDWVLLLFTMLSACFVSSMGIMLAAIMLGVIALADTFIHKNIRNWKKIILCCIPNIIFALIYLFIR